MKLIARISLAGLLSLSILPALAGTARAACPGINSGFYNGFNGTSCDGNRLIHSQAPAGSRDVGVAHNAVSSANNGTGNKWCGVDADPLNDHTVFTFFSHTNYGALGGANNEIDHFDVVTGGGDCPE